MTEKKLTSALMLAPPAALLFTTPINHTKTLMLLMLALSLGLGIYTWRREKLSPPRFTLPALAAWIGICVLSLSWSLDVDETISELKNEIFYGMVAFFSMYWLSQSERAWRVNLISLCAGLFFIFGLILATGQWRWASETMWDWGHGYALFSTYLATLAPLLIVLLTGRPFRYSRAIGILALITILIAATLNTNRMLFITLGATLCLGTGLLTWRYARSVSKTRLVIGLVISAAIFILAANHALKLRLPQANMSTTEIVEYYKDKAPRTTIWAYWLERVSEEPWTGVVGYGRRIMNHGISHDDRPDWNELWFGHAHNLFLDMAAQIGLPGLLAFVAVILSLFLHFWKFYRSPDPELSGVGLSGVCLVMAVMLKNQTDDTFSNSMSLFFWALAGMILGYGTYLQGRLDTRPRQVDDRDAHP